MARWRTKSVARTLDEIEILQRDFGKRYFVFVDDTFNVDPKWCDAFAEEVLRRGLKFQFYAFLRADLILRDEKLGVFEKLVRAGLIHAAIGVERLSDEELKNFHKGFQTENTIRQCYAPPAHEVSAGVRSDDLPRRPAQRHARVDSGAGRVRQITAARLCRLSSIDARSGHAAVARSARKGLDSC